MKYILLITLLIISTKSWSQEWTWGLKAAGNSQSPYDPSTEIHVDYQGNKVIAGYFQKNFSLGSHSIYTEDDYYSDIFLSRINDKGEVEWLKQIEGGSSYGYDIGLTVDDESNIYLTGSNGNIFVSKYDSLGNIIWNQDFNNKYYGYGRTIATDQFDNVYVAGGGGWTFFMAKLDYYGNTVWEKDLWFNGSDACNITDISVDALGNIFFVGVFDIAVLTLGDFELVHYGGWGDNTFFGKLNTNGDFIWINSPIGRTNSNPQIALSTCNNLYLSGALYSGIKFDSIEIEGICCQNPTPYIAKYDTDGNIIWAKGGYTTYEKKGVPYDIKVDSDDNLYLTGNYFTCTGSFCTESDFYLEEYNKDGNHLWRQEFKMASDDYSHGIDIDNYGYCYIVGYNYSTNFIDQQNYHSLRSIGIGKLNTFTSTPKRTKRPSIERLHIICPDMKIDTLKVQGERIKWYDDISVNNLVYEGNSYLPDITASDTFFITQTKNDIESWPKEVIIHFSELTNTSLHFSNDTLLVDEGIYFTYQWYLNGDSIQNGNKNYIVIDTIGTFSVNIKEGECEKWIDTTMASSSIEQKLEKDNLLLFPNPTIDGAINLIMRVDSIANLNIRVSNLNGSIIMDRELNILKGLVIDKVDLSGFSKGIYILNIRGGGLNITKKILIQ